MTNNRFKLENMLIRSYAHLRSFKLKSYFKAIEDLKINGLLNEYESHSMTRMQGSRCLMHAYNPATGDYESYCVDIDTLTAKRLDLNIGYFTNCLIEGQYTIVVRYGKPMAILRDLQKIGQIEFDGKYKWCKNGQLINGRCE